MILASILFVLGAHATLESNMHAIVQTGRETMPVVWSSVKKNLKKVPKTKREARRRFGTDPKTGKPFMLALPADL